MMEVDESKMIDFKRNSGARLRKVAEYNHMEASEIQVSDRKCICEPSQKKS